MESVATTEFPQSDVNSPEAPQSPEEPTGNPIQTITTITSTISSYDEEEMDREPANDPCINSLEDSTTLPLSPTTPTNTTSPIKHLPHRDSSWLEIDVCREFLRGECTRSAEECKYAHPTGSVVVKDGNKVTCCFDFLKDRCTRETCKYLHPSNVVKERLVMAGKQYGQNMVALSNKPLITSPLSPAMQPLQVGGAYSVPFQYMSSQQMPTPSSTLPHQPQLPHNGLQSMYSLPYYSNQIKLEVCESFEQGYQCVKGNDCLFPHPEPYVRRNPDNSVTVCWNYLDGYCRHNKCWFYHPTPIQLMVYQFPNRTTISQQQPSAAALDSTGTLFLSPYSPTTEPKVTSPLQPPQLSPSAMLSPYPFVIPQVIPVTSSFPQSHPTQFSTTTLPQPQIDGSARAMHTNTSVSTEDAICHPLGIQLRPPLSRDESAEDVHLHTGDTGTSIDR